MVGLFGAKCPVCGMKLKDNAVESNGKKFCSKEHAEQHEAEAKALLEKLDKGCCGLKVEK